MNEGRYLRDGYGAASGESVLHRRFVYDHRRLSLVANLLFAKGLGPRLYDLVEIQVGDFNSTAYIVEHAGGQTPSMTQCKTDYKAWLTSRSKAFSRSICLDGFADEDFECPSCNGNALIGRDEKFYYIDFQNFLLVKYETYLRRSP